MFEIRWFIQDATLAVIAGLLQAQGWCYMEDFIPREHAISLRNDILVRKKQCFVFIIRIVLSREFLLLILLLLLRFFTFSKKYISNIAGHDL